MFYLFSSTHENVGRDSECPMEQDVFFFFGHFGSELGKPGIVLGLSLASLEI